MEYFRIMLGVVAGIAYAALASWAFGELPRRMAADWVYVIMPVILGGAFLVWYVVAIGWPRRGS